MLTSGLEYHYAMPMVSGIDDRSPILLDYPVETRLQVIMYPNQLILDGQLKRSLRTQKERVPPIGKDPRTRWAVRFLLNR